LRLRIAVLLACREVRDSLRGRWLVIGASAFGILAVAVAGLGMAGSEQWGISALDRTSAALLNLVLLFVPLLTLPLGASSFSGEKEDGTLPYLVAQPITRMEVFSGKLLGLLAAMSLSLLIGFGGAAAWLGIRGGVPAGSFAVLALGAWLLGIVTTTLGVLLSVATKSRARALAAAMGVWLALVFLCDFGVLALAASQTLGPAALFSISLANPLQASKTLSALAISERLEILGPVGIHAVRELGRPMLAALLCGTLAAWTLASAGCAWLFFRRENLA